jgi:crotonobetainyl-CoA:carnitine CoA-transferase CaiB-like acyl-CoA transferase
VLSKAVGIPAHERVPDAQAYERREEAAAGIARALKARTTAEWSEIFTRLGVWHSAVNDYSRLADDPQVIHNKSFMTVAGATGAPVTLVAHPVRYDGAAPQVRLAPQKLGAQTADILSELGYDDRAIGAFFENGVVSGERRDEAASEPTLV